MQSAASTGSANPSMPSMSADIAALAAVKDETIALQAEQIAALEHQLEWFRATDLRAEERALHPRPDPQQLHLGETAQFPRRAREAQERAGPHPARHARTAPRPARSCRSSMSRRCRSARSHLVHADIVRA
jgi:hypothetical protein